MARVSFFAQADYDARIAPINAQLRNPSTTPERRIELSVEKSNAFLLMPRYEGIVDLTDGRFAFFGDRRVEMYLPPLGESADHGPSDFQKGLEEATFLFPMTRHAVVSVDGAWSRTVNDLPDIDELVVLVPAAALGGGSTRAPRVSMGDALRGIGCAVAAGRRTRRVVVFVPDETARELDADDVATLWAALQGRRDSSFEVVVESFSDPGVLTDAWATAASLAGDSRSVFTARIPKPT